MVDISIIGWSNRPTNILGGPVGKSRTRTGTLQGHLLDHVAKSGWHLQYEFSGGVNWDNQDISPSMAVYSCDHGTYIDHVYNVIYMITYLYSTIYIVPYNIFCTYIHTLRTKPHRNPRVSKITSVFRQNPRYFHPFWKYGLGTGRVQVRYGLVWVITG